MVLCVIIGVIIVFLFYKEKKNLGTVTGYVLLFIVPIEIVLFIMMINYYITLLDTYGFFSKLFGTIISIILIIIILIIVYILLNFFINDDFDSKVFGKDINNIYTFFKKNINYEQLIQQFIVIFFIILLAKLF